MCDGADWAAARGAKLIGLAATGVGGGQWTVAVVDGTPASLHVGLPSAACPTVRIAATVLTAVLDGVLTFDAVWRSGALVIEGDAANHPAALAVLQRLPGRLRREAPSLAAAGT